MIAEFVGAVAGAFDSLERDSRGNEVNRTVNYAKVFVITEINPDLYLSVIGRKCEVFKVPFLDFEELFEGVEPGDRINLLFDSRGRVEYVQKVGAG